MNQINNHLAQTEVIKGTAFIVDVREPKEFKENHIPGAINLPSTKYNKNNFGAFEKVKICLVCESGQRANSIANKLEKDGFEQVFLLTKQMQDIPKLNTSNGWSVDRQFRMLLGLLLALFITLHFFELKYAVIVPIILSTGLIFTSLIDRCYMRIGISKLPWNRGKKTQD